jgi:hypothetical protein
MLNVEAHHSVDQGLVDRSALQTHGFTLGTATKSCESYFQEQLLTLALDLGTPVATRSNGNLCEVLAPKEARDASPNSLSGLHSSGEFPLHCDTAHWLIPCRFVILACLSPGKGDRPTFILDTLRLPLGERQSLLLRSTPLRVNNGRNSFFSTILSNARAFVRFDPGCMTAVTPKGVDALQILSKSNWPDYIEVVRWEPGTFVVIDNRRVLHGRGPSHTVDGERKLLRISIR